MKTLQTKLNIFLGNCVYAANGERISLPMKEYDLKDRIKEIQKKYGELIISDYQIIDSFITDLTIGQYDDIYELNFVLNQCNEFIALYINGDNDLEYAKSMWKSGKYLYLPGVSSTKELGEAVAKLGLVSKITKSAIESGYVDFEKIGHDFECNGIRLYNNLGAIGQISDDNYKKWHQKIKKERPSLREFLLKKGVPVDELDSHESDLYIKVTRFNEETLSQYEKLYEVALSKSPFICEISHCKWYDIAFGNMKEHYQNKNNDISLSL